MGGQGLMPIAVSACDKVVDVCRNLSFRIALHGPLPLIEGIFESFGKGNSNEHVVLDCQPDVDNADGYNVLVL